MIIDCIADLHGYYPELEGGDLLLLCGDYTASDHIFQWAEFFSWLKKQDYEKKILIGGNHDNFLESGFPKTQKEANDLREVQEYLEIDHSDFEYLCDSGTEYKGYKIWGSPWSPWFYGVNPKCTAFMKRESALQDHFELIPKDTAILMTHCPPYMILDETKNGKLCGSFMLRYQMDTRICPKIVCFGHIHEQGGKEMLFKNDFRTTKFINCSFVNERYRPVNKPKRLKL